MSASSGIINSGQKANSMGNLLESFVSDTLVRLGYSYFNNHSKQIFENRKAIGGDNNIPLNSRG